MKYQENPADIAADIIKRKAAEAGLELTEDFEERIAEMRAYCAEPVMTWRNEFPTKPRAYYWIRNVKIKGSHQSDWWRETRVVFVDVDIDIYFVGTDEILRSNSVESAEWYGPIDPPE